MNAKRGFFGFFRGIASADDGEVLEQEDVLVPRAHLDAEADFDDEDDPKSGAVTIPPEVVEEIRGLLQQLIEGCGFSSTVSVGKQPARRLLFDIENASDLGRIIGKDGQTLEAFQTLLRAMVYKRYPLDVKLIVDASGYRTKRFETLRAVAMRAARSVGITKDRIPLKPMNASDRRQIHMLFKNHRSVRSISEGSGHNRHVVLERRNGEG
jgi:spoIIIJ-associated protein